MLSGLLSDLVVLVSGRWFVASPWDRDRDLIHVHFPGVEQFAQCFLCVTAQALEQPGKIELQVADRVNVIFHHVESGTDQECQVSQIHLDWWREEAVGDREDHDPDWAWHLRLLFLENNCPVGLHSGDVSLYDFEELSECSRLLEGEFVTEIVVGEALDGCQYFTV